jgi:iron complex outermembrane receptor protein
MADVYTLGELPVNKSARNIDTVPLPKVTLSYQAPQDVMLYASVAEGFESGKIDPTTSTLISYKPETGWTYEVGAKGYAIDRKLYYELAAYYNNEYDRQVEASVVNSQDIPTKTITNVGPSTTKGIEGTLSWRPIQGLSFDGSVAYMDAKWTGDASYKSIPLAGLAPPNSPDWTAHIGATYSTPVSSKLKVSLHSDAAYTGSFSWLLPSASILANPSANLNPSYWVVFARVALATIDDRWELAVRADNLFNQKYFTEFDTAIYSAGLTSNGACVIANCSIGAPGALRRVTVSLTGKF